jgi:ABC-type phosphate transport system substrate-binding protein
MTKRIRFLLPAAAAASLLLAAGPALAARVTTVMVTGHVTAVSGADSVTIDGRTYPIAQGSAAASAVAQVQPGELVDVTLNGSAASAASQVVAIAPHQGN